MNGVKKLAYGIVLSAAVALAGTAGAATKKIGNINWTYVKVKGGVQIGDGVNVAAVPCCSPMLSGTVTIPSKIGSLAVKSIAANAFKGCDAITAVKVPKGVTSVGEDAFHGCSSLVAVSMPTTVKTYGASVFANCSALKTAPLPKGLKVIPDCAFWQCEGLTSVTIPATVTSIGNFAFRGCNSLRSIKVSATVKGIWFGAFASCNGLESATIYAKDIGGNAFYNCPNLKLAILRSGVANIGNNAFADCPNLEAVAMPHSLTNFASSAFDATPKWKEVRYEVEGDDAMFRYMLLNAGFSSASVNSKNFRLWCQLSVKPNSTKYGTAVILDDEDQVSSTWAYPDDEDDEEKLKTLVAKPKKGYYFAGWYLDKACKSRLPADWLYEGEYRSKTVKIYMPRKHTTIYAKFITKAADKKALKFTAAAKKLAKTATVCSYENDWGFVAPFVKVPAVSATLPTYSAKGLPAGLQIDSKTGEILGLPTKPGAYTVTVTAKSAAGNKVTQKVKITVNATSWAQGTYRGYAQFTATAPAANLTFTVGKTGKVTGKVVYKDKSYSFTSQLSYSNPYRSEFSPSIKIGKTTYKPGKVDITYDYFNYETTGETFVEAAAHYWSMMFCAHKKPGLVVEEGPLELLASWRCNLTDDELGANLQVSFQNGDTVLVTGTIGGKSVSCSSQLCLFDGYDRDPYHVYRIVAPVIIYKSGFYRVLDFTFFRYPDGSIEPAEKKIISLGDAYSHYF